MLVEESKLVQLSRLLLEPERIDDQSNNVIQGGKYLNLPEIVKNIFTISHGSADIKGDFPLSGRVLRKERASMNERTLGAKLAVIDRWDRYLERPQNVVVTEDLIKLAKSARETYYLDIP